MAATIKDQIILSNAIFIAAWYILAFVIKRQGMTGTLSYFLVFLFIIYPLAVLFISFSSKLNIKPIHFFLFFVALYSYLVYEIIQTQDRLIIQIFLIFIAIPLIFYFVYKQSKNSRTNKSNKGGLV